MTTDFFRRYIDILAEAETKVTPDQEMRARDIAAQMGVVAPNLADIEYNAQGVAIKINGDAVPKNLYGPEEQKKMQGATTPTAPGTTPAPGAKPEAKPEAGATTTPAPLGVSDKITELQKELKAKGADLGTFGPAGDGIDGKLGAKTRAAAEKFPEIATKYKEVLGSGQAASPAANTTTPGPKVDTKDPNALANALGAIEAVLAKYKIKAEGVNSDQKTVLENLNEFSPQEQVAIWKLLSEADLPKMPVGAKFDRASGNWYTTSPTGGKTFIGGLQPQQSKWAKFASKLGGGKGIAKKIAGRVAGSAVTGPAAAVVGAGMLAWTAWDVGKALYDTFSSTELADLDPADQEIVKKNMAVIMQYQKDPKQMSALSPELKTRVERALKGLDALAVQAGSEEPETQAASPQPTPKSEPTVTTKNELRIAGEPFVPGQPLSQKQIAAMQLAISSGNTYPPEVMAQYNKQKT
jgi:sulfur carrier protein ThiS